MQVTDAEIAKLFGYLEFCLQQVVADNELGALVDADLARESSALEGIKVRQQLGIQTLGLANQGPQVLLGLFRN
jgi:flagellin-like hook-associated protein FlgL